MASYDGHVKIGTELDSTGLKKGLDGLGGLAKKGFSVIGGAAKTAVTAATGAITAGMAAVAGGVTAAVNVGKEFEAEMSVVSSISGATGEDFEVLKAKAKEMGATTKFSATESAKAMEYMAMAGWKTTDMLEGIGGIMSLAAASGESLATTSDIVTDAMTAFGMAADGTSKVIKDGIAKEVSNAAHFADVLAAASSNANTNVGMMGDTFKYVAPVAGALGYNVEDAAVAIGLMANSGIKASQSGTALRSLLSRLAKPTDQVANAMDRLGISLTDESGEMKSLNQLMLDMREGFKGLAEDEKASTAAVLAGQEGMSGLLAIVTASDKDFNALRTSIDNCTGSAEHMADVAQNNLAGQLTILQSTAEALGIEIYESLQQPLTDLAKYAVEAVGDLNDAFKSGGVNGLVKAGSELLSNVLLGIAQKTPEVVEMGVSVARNFIRQISNNLPAFLKAGKGILEAVTVGIAEILPDIGRLGLRIIYDLLHVIADHAPEAVEYGAGLMVSLMNGISSKVPFLSELSIKALSTFVTTILDNLPLIVESGANLLQNLGLGIANALPVLADIALQVLDTLAGSISSGIEKIVETGRMMLTELVAGIAERIPQLADTAVSIVTQLVSGLSEMLPDIASSAAKIFVTLVESLCSADNLTKLVESGIDLILNLAEGLLEAIPDLIDAVPVIIGNLAAAIITNIPRLLEAAIEIMLRLGEFLFNNTGKLIMALPNIFKEIARAFTELSWSDIGKNLIDGIKNGIFDAAGSLAQSVVDAAKGALDAVKKCLGIHSPSRVARDLIGKNIIAGIGVGIEDETPALEEASAESASRAVKAMQGVSAQDAVASLKQGAYDNTRLGYMPGDWEYRPDPEPEPIDYDKLGQSVAKALNGTEVTMDRKKVGKLVTPTVNEELERIRARKV